jgi:hypothetical protein
MTIDGDHYNGVTGAVDGDGGPSVAASAPAPPAAAAARSATQKARTSDLGSGLAPLPAVTPLTRLLDLPAFVLAAFFLYWSVALGTLLGYIRPWAGNRRRDDALGW